MPRLKVFTASMGFYETVVAAPSRTAALRAWGSRQDLFKEGLADVTSDPAATAAALASPGLVLSRAQGSKGEFKQAATPQRARRSPEPRRKTAAPDRGELTRAEKALSEQEDAHRRARRALERELAEVRDRIDDLDRAQANERRAAISRRDEARRKYRRAAGKTTG